MGAITNTRNVVRIIQVMQATNVRVINLFSMSVQHTVDFESLCCLLNGSRYNVPGMFKWAVGAVGLTLSFQSNLVVYTCVNMLSIEFTR